MTASPPRPAEDLPRSVRKRRTILEAATTLFLRNGYLGTSMDEIAALARVSKQTVYKHFADKKGLSELSGRSLHAYGGRRRPLCTGFRWRSGVRGDRRRRHSLAKESSD